MTKYSSELQKPLETRQKTECFPQVSFQSRSTKQELPSTIWLLSPARNYLIYFRARVLTLVPVPSTFPRTLLPHYLTPYLTCFLLLTPAYRLSGSDHFELYFVFKHTTYQLYATYRLLCWNLLCSSTIHWHVHTVKTETVISEPILLFTKYIHPGYLYHHHGRL